ncbi:MAG: universal stress protein [Chloroflexota bacterium]
MFRKVILALDGSDCAMQAAEAALGLAAEQEASLYVLSVIEHMPHYAATVGESEEEYERATAYFQGVQQPVLDRAAELGVAAEGKIAVGNPPQVIVHATEEPGTDLLVIGHSGHSGAWGRFLGTTVDKVARHAHCSVLIVR